MATVDAYVPMNMLTGFNFSNLLLRLTTTTDTSDWFAASHYNGTDDVSRATASLMIITGTRPAQAQ